MNYKVLSQSRVSSANYLVIPITPQANRAPAFPVLVLSTSPPFPKSSSFA